MNIKRSYLPLSASITLIMTFTLILLALLCSKALHLYGHRLAFAITIDLVLVLPVIPMVFSYRFQGSKYISSALFTAGIIIAGLVIPTNEQGLLHHFKVWIVPLVEAASIIFLVVKVKNVLKAYKHSEKINDDFYSTLKKVTYTMIPNRIAYIVASEIAVMYYLFFHKGKIKYDNKDFSYHKETSTIVLFAVLIFMIFVETTAFHLLLTKWSPKAAWVFSIISAYSALQLLGMVRAFYSRPIQIKGNILTLRYGILAETEIPVADIECIELETHMTGDEQGVQRLSPLNNLETYNTIIKLRQPANISFIYGKVKTYQTLAFHVDNKVLFKEELDNRISIIGLGQSSQ